MDIFNLKRVEELEKKLYNAELERDKYRDELMMLEKKFEAFDKACNEMAKDCKPGPWCRACSYRGIIHYHDYTDYITYCRKGVDGCPNLILSGGYHTKEED